MYRMNRQMRIEDFVFPYKTIMKHLRSTLVELICRCFVRNYHTVFSFHILIFSQRAAIINLPAAVGTWLLRVALVGDSRKGFFFMPTRSGG